MHSRLQMSLWWSLHPLIWRCRPVVSLEIERRWPLCISDWGIPGQIECLLHQLRQVLEYAFIRSRLDMKDADADPRKCAWPQCLVMMSMFAPKPAWDCLKLHLLVVSGASHFSLLKLDWLLRNMVDITIRKRPKSEAIITQRKFFKKTARGKVIKGMLWSKVVRTLLTILRHSSTWTLFKGRRCLWNRALQAMSSFAGNSSLGTGRSQSSFISIWPLYLAGHKCISISSEFFLFFILA